MARPTEPTPVRVVAGHYGSGKSEFAVSLALRDAARGRRVALVDLDVVNPYCRSREHAAELAAAGVWVISSSLGHTAAIEIPAISAQARAPIADPAWDVILDLGGDAAGAKVVVQFREEVRRRGYRLLIVVNAHRINRGLLPDCRTGSDFEFRVTDDETATAASIVAQLSALPSRSFTITVAPTTEPV